MAGRHASTFTQESAATRTARRREEASARASRAEQRHGLNADPAAVENHLHSGIAPESDAESLDAPANSNHCLRCRTKEGSEQFAHDLGNDMEPVQVPPELQGLTQVSGQQKQCALVDLPSAV